MAKELPMKRRTFVKNGLLVSGALALPPLLPAQGGPGAAPVVQVRGDSPYEITTTGRRRDRRHGQDRRPRRRGHDQAQYRLEPDG